MSDDKLKQCPFCGGEDLGWSSQYVKNAAVECCDCFAEGPPEHNKQEAIAAWNKRTPVNEWRCAVIDPPVEPFHNIGVYAAWNDGKVTEEAIGWIHVYVKWRGADKRHVTHWMSRELPAPPQRTGWSNESAQSLLNGTRIERQPKRTLDQVIADEQHTDDKE